MRQRLFSLLLQDEVRAGQGILCAHCMLGHVAENVSEVVMLNRKLADGQRTLFAGRYLIVSLKRESVYGCKFL